MKKSLIIISIISILTLTGCTFQSGTSKDTVYGWDKGIIWHHAYLTNDHTTAYCFDNENFIPLLEQSQKNNTKVIFTYKTYLIRGFLCQASEKYETVVLEDVQPVRE